MVLSCIARRNVAAGRMVKTMIHRDSRGGFSIYEFTEQRSGLGPWLIFDDSTGPVKDGDELACCMTLSGAQYLMDLMVRGIVAIPSRCLNARLDKAQYSSDTFNRSANDESEYYPMSFRTKQPSDT